MIMTEYGRLRQAFISIYEEPVREPQNQNENDVRNANEICWLAKNVWLQPNDPNEPDLQINAWHGEAWGHNTKREAGLWCGLNIENKPVFKAALRFATAESTVSIARALDNYRVSFGSKSWPSNKFQVINCGESAVAFDFQSAFLRIPQFNGDRILRPQLQIYRQIGVWRDASNTVNRLAQEIAAVRCELSQLFQLWTGGVYPADS